MTRCLVALLVLAGCANEPSRMLGSTPAMVAMCVPNHEPRNVSMQRAEAECQKHGRHAELIPSQKVQCRTALLQSQEGWVYNFRCAP